EVVQETFRHQRYFGTIDAFDLILVEHHIRSTGKAQPQWAVTFANPHTRVALSILGGDIERLVALCYGRARHQERFQNIPPGSDSADSAQVRANPPAIFPDPMTRGALAFFEEDFSAADIVAAI